MTLSFRLGFATTVCVMAVLFAAGLAESAVAADGAEVVDVSGTEWVGSDTPSSFITTYRFEPDGKVSYYYNGTSYTNGTWTQDGDNVKFELNDHYRDADLTVSGDVLQGKSWNVKDQKWTTTLYRHYEPKRVDGN